MNSQYKNKYVIAGSVLLAFALCFAMGAFPHSAEANFSYGSTAYGCPHPYVYPNGYFYCPTPHAQPQPIVYQPQPIYQPVYQPVYQNLTASCYAANSSIQVGGSVQWVAYASGGTGSYGYTWTGTDGFNGSGQAVYMNYYNPGVKTANVTVYSGGQNIVANCSNSVIVNDYTYYNYQQPYQPAFIPTPIYNNYLSSNQGLDIGCYSDPSSALTNQPVNWNVEVTGGSAPYTYSWTGTDGLSGNQSSVVKYYGTSGSKSAIVSVTSVDGLTGTKACTTNLTVRNPARPAAPAPVVTPVTPAAPVQATPTQPASAAFSLNGVPWGWVAVLVILVLFCTSMYLLFNRPKI